MDIHVAISLPRTHDLPSAVAASGAESQLPPDGKSWTSPAGYIIGVSENGVFPNFFCASQFSDNPIF
jgi:hypothetical protein